MNILQLAGSLPRDPQFREFVRESLAALVREKNLDIDVQDVSADDAAAFIRIICEIESRRELATNASAQQSFHRFIRRPFLAWRAKQHQPLRRAA
jgi:hypothetical protein